MRVFLPTFGTDEGITKTIPVFFTYVRSFLTMVMIFMQNCYLPIPGFRISSWDVLIGTFIAILSISILSIIFRTNLNSGTSAGIGSFKNYSIKRKRQSNSKSKKG